MKITKIIVVIALFICILSACGNEVQSEVTTQPIIMETPAPMPVDKETLAEQEAEELFAVYKERIEKGQYPLFRELEDLYNNFPDNATIKNYYYFTSAAYYLLSSELDNSPSTYQKFEDNLSMVDIELPCKYQAYFTNYIENNMGLVRYNELRGAGENKLNRYNRLTENEKLQLLIRIIQEEDKIGDSITEEQTSTIWESIAEEYGITEEDVMVIMLDEGLMKKAYKYTAPEQVEEDIGDYDARLRNEGYRVTIAATKEYMSEFVQAVVNDNQSKIDQLFNSGLLAYVPDGTRVNVVDVGIGIAEVEILEGRLKGIKAFTIIECVEYK